MKKYKLAILASHPVQYRAPLFEKLAEHPEIDLMVYFCRDYGVKERMDPGFGKIFKWDIPLLDGYRYKFLKNYGLSAKYSFFGQINPGIINELRRTRYDAIFVYGYNFVTNLMTILLAKIMKIPVLYQCESSLYYDSHIKRQWWAAVFKKVFFKILFSSISGFLAIGTRNKEFYRAYGVPSSRIFDCPYAVNNEFFMKEAEKYKDKRKELKSSLGINPDFPVILSVSKLIENKRPMDALRAYENLSDIPKKALVFVGDGRLRPILESYVKKNKVPDVYFLGFQNQKELPKFYATADIFLSPYGPNKGDWGLVVNEAMACGLPIVCTDAVGAHEDLVREGENGFVSSTGDIKALSGRLGDLLSNPERLQNMKKRSLEIISGWGYEEDIKGILKALKSCCKGSYEVK